MGDASLVIMRIRYIIYKNVCEYKSRRNVEESCHIHSEQKKIYHVKAETKRMRIRTVCVLMMK